MTTSSPPAGVAAARDGAGASAPIPPAIGPATATPEERPMTTRSLPRLVPAPQCEPPYDDELGGAGPDRPEAAGTPSAQGTLALAFKLPNGLPARPSPPPQLRLVPGQHEVDFDPDFAPQPTSRCELPDPRAWSARFVQALIEVLWGGRPASQLLRWTTIDVHQAVQRRAGVATRLTRATAGRPMLRSLRVCEPNDGVAEVCAVVHRAGRTQAIALRLEGIDRRWQCTVLELG